jgi:hypothetical protein
MQEKKKPGFLRLTGRYALAFSRQFAAGEINGFAASAALVGTIELVGEDFFFLAAFRAFAVEGFQVFKIGISGTVLWCGGVLGHDSLLKRFNQ